MKMPKWGKRYEPLVNSLSGQSNTCRQNRREAVTQSQGTLLQTTRRSAKTAGEFEFGKKSTPGCNIVSSDTRLQPFLFPKISGNATGTELTGEKGANRPRAV